MPWGEYRLSAWLTKAACSALSLGQAAATRASCCILFFLLLRKKKMAETAPAVVPEAPSAAAPQEPAAAASDEFRFDVAVVGTGQLAVTQEWVLGLAHQSSKKIFVFVAGLVQSILAAALARIGKRVLHIDS